MNNLLVGTVRPPEAAQKLLRPSQHCTKVDWKRRMQNDEARRARGSQVKGKSGATKKREVLRINQGGGDTEREGEIDGERGREREREIYIYINRN